MCFNYALNANLLTNFDENKFDAGTTPALNDGLPNLNTGTFDTSGSPTYKVQDGSIANFGSQNCNCPLKENLGGRFGFAYQLHPNTVVRGAFGQVYNSVGYFGTIFGSAMTHNVPVVTSESVGNSSGTTPVYSYPTLPASPAQFPIPSNGLIPILNGIGYNVRPDLLLLPKVDQYNASLQRQVGENTTFTIASVGNIGERVYPGETEGYNINQYVLPSNPADLTATDNLTIIPVCSAKTNGGPTSTDSLPSITEPIRSAAHRTSTTRAPLRARTTTPSRQRLSDASRTASNSSPTTPGRVR